MADKQQYVVVGPLVIAQAGPRLVYVYKDGILPDDVSVEEAQRLVETGLVAALDQPPPAEELAAAAGPERPERPAAGAPKADWVEWAVAATGLSREAAEALTKDKLAALPG